MIDRLFSWFLKLLVRLGVIAFLSLIIAYFMHICMAVFYDLPVILTPFDVLQDWNNADGGGGGVLLSLYLFVAIILLCLIFRPAFRTIDKFTFVYLQKKYPYSADDLVVKLELIKELLEKNADKMGQGVSAKGIVAFLNDTIAQLSVGERPDWNKLLIIFAPSGHWDDLMVSDQFISGVSVQELVNEIFQMISYFEPRASE